MGYIELKNAAIYYEIFGAENNKTIVLIGYYLKICKLIPFLRLLKRDLIKRRL